MTNLALYVPTGSFQVAKNPFGKDTANLGMFQALARYGGFEEIGVLSNGRPDPAAVSSALFDGCLGQTRLWTESVLRTSAATRAGAVLRGLPDIGALAWQRQTVGDRSHSLLGLIHTLAPPAIRDQLAAAVTAPIQPWDALICTSPAVQDAARDLMERTADYLNGRFGGTELPMPRLPLIPLGVDFKAISADANRPDARIRTRNSLGLREEDPLVLWLGRLSHEEKAFPQPMFRAVEEARSLTGTSPHFVLAGWFPEPATGPTLYRDAAVSYAPNIPVHFVNGNDKAAIADIWAAADIFISLVDNVQETFGLTLLEAMAAGLPVVASDWDGYRYTVRNGVEGFLVPTLGGPPGAGRLMMQRQVFGLDAYQTYVGTVASHTAVDTSRAAESLANLFRNPDLRRRMGAAGRTRVESTFDWPIVARQIHALVEELAIIRAEAPRFGRKGPSDNPVKRDPFTDFADFATSSLSPDTRISLYPHPAGRSPHDQLALAERLGLDRYGAMWRANFQECTNLIDYLSDGTPRQVKELLHLVVQERKELLLLAVGWLCKLGILRWEL